MKPETGVNRTTTNRSDDVITWSDDVGDDKLRFLFTSTLTTLPGRRTASGGISENLHFLVADASLQNSLSRIQHYRRVSTAAITHFPG